MTLKIIRILLLIFLISSVSSVAGANVNEEDELWRSMAASSLVTLLESQAMNEDELLWVLVQDNEQVVHNCMFDTAETLSAAVPEKIAAQYSLCELIESL